ncbi:MaoC family dehydratase [Microbacterium jiangjiandongii]|uniref:MaoC family dehydratase n=1 Tax=Microbacterium jiangjiandongii TaxID=3049071 RepID=UPI00214B869D|nr:MaoC family dehydratase [Microbacterium sp. zg.Y843]MCR2815353.1 MaoC family dehydratase [Microbacterium sp. zg.Y843]
MDVTYDQLQGMKGAVLGPSEYRTITQDDIQAFADLTDDHYWLHVDTEKSADGPFGTTIAHGYLTLAMISALWPGLLWVTDAPLMVNYGFERVRFTAPVLSGSGIRMQAKIADVLTTARGCRLQIDMTIERENEERPAIVATCLFDLSRPDGSAGHSAPHPAD